MSRQREISQFFQLLESKYGSFNQLVNAGAQRVITTDELSPGALSDLFQHKACAVHVPGFFSKTAAARLSRRLLKDDQRRNWYLSHSERGSERSEVDAVGLPYNVALAQHKLDEYYDAALRDMRKLRKDVVDESNPVELDPESEVLSPLDKLRLQLDEMWPTGATLTKDRQGRPHVAGLGRISEPAYGPNDGHWTGGFMHVDDLSVMTPKRGLFSANVYVQQPPVGGELQIWPISFFSRWDFYRHAATLSQLLVQDTQGQIRLREMLPEPITIAPQNGDLVLLCAQRPHAVRGPIHGSPRVSMQSFIQYDESKPLQLEN